MGTVSEKPFYSFFNVIICRYNEIGLKSKQVRARMEYGLIDFAKAICQREELNLLSVLRLGGRLIFFFHPEQIIRAIPIFRHIIGFCSISPGFAIDTEYEIVRKNALEFAESYIQDGDTFAVRAKRIKPYPKESQEIEREIGGQIHDRLTQLSRKIKVNLTTPTKTIYIEVREKGAYIYAQKIPTIWGGNPIESDKASLAFITENPESLLGAQLLLRRGTFLAPFVLDWGKFAIPGKITTVFDSLKILAQFYSGPMTAVRLFVEPLYSVLMKTPENQARCNYLFFALVDKLVQHMNNRHILKYNHRPLMIKGITTAFEPSQRITLQVSQLFPTITFTPIIALSSAMRNELTTRLFSAAKPWNWQTDPQTFAQEEDKDFSLADIVNAHIETNGMNKEEAVFQQPCCPFEIIPSQLDGSIQKNIVAYLDDKQIEELKNEVNSPAIQTIFQNIIDHSEFLSIKGRILEENKKY